MPDLINTGLAGCHYLAGISIIFEVRNAVWNNKNNG